jgi:hypothetical protein
MVAVLAALGIIFATAAAETVLVYELAGTLQCYDDPGRTPAEAAGMLRSLGVEVLDAERRLLPPPMPERCKAPTGEVNVMAIPAADWRQLQASGRANEQYRRWTFDGVAAAPAATVEVFRPDGSLQCEPGTAIALATMALELTDAGIAVLDSHKGDDGMMRPAVCGAPTGAINVYRIDAADLAGAEGLGFHPLNP